MANDRLEKLKKEIQKMGLDGILVSDPANIFYLSGITFFEPTEREGFLLITTNKNYVITSSLYTEAVQKYLRGFTLLETTIKKSLEKNLRGIFKITPLKKIGFEEASLTVSEYNIFKKTFKLSPAGGLVEKLRAIKNQGEIEKIKKACRVTDEAFDYILSEIKEGGTEREISDKLERFFRNKDMSSSFSPVIAFGPNSSRPHHISGNTKLSRNQIILMDFGVRNGGYCSDFTRTVFFGSPTAKFKKIYQTVLDAQNKAIEFINSQLSTPIQSGSMVNNQLFAHEVDKIARNHIIERGFPSIPYSLGHGIGIDVHESPSLSPKSKSGLKNGMVFSIEPGIYLNGWGGVRIEDLFLLEENSLKKITYSASEIISL